MYYDKADIDKLMRNLKKKKQTNTKHKHIHTLTITRMVRL